MVELKSPLVKGSLPHYKDSDFYWTMHMMSEGGRVSRKAIGDELNLGEGSVRGILSILKSCGLCDTYQTGSTMTAMGFDLYRRLGIAPVPLRSDDPGVSRCAVVVKGGGVKVGRGTEVRDAGIRSGGTGCLAFVLKDGRLECPPHLLEMEDVGDVEVPGIMGEGDALVVGSGENVFDAKAAAVGGALVLVDTDELPRIGTAGDDGTG